MKRLIVAIAFAILIFSGAGVWSLPAAAQGPPGVTIYSNSAGGTGPGAFQPASPTNPVPTYSVAGPSTSTCPSVIAVNQTTSTDLHTFTAKGHICSIMLISATAQSITLAEGTGSVCASGTAYLIGGSGGTTALAANGGFSMVAGTPWLDMQTAADHLCLDQSSTGNVSGVITYSDH